MSRPVTKLPQGTVASLGDRPTYEDVVLAGVLGDDWDGWSPGAPKVSSDAEPARWTPTRCGASPRSFGASDASRQAAEALR
jgi:hypothetical protein